MTGRRRVLKRAVRRAARPVGVSLGLAAGLPAGPARRGGKQDRGFVAVGFSEEQAAARMRDHYYILDSIW